MDKNWIKVLAVLIVFLQTSLLLSQESVITDDRDGNTYKTITLGEQRWLAENLRYDTEDSKCYKNKKKHCLTDGRLYPYTDLEKVCPKGWKVPNKKDWESLKKHIKDEDLVFDLENMEQRKTHLHLKSSGYQMGRNLFMGKGKATSFWLDQYNEWDEYYHVHIYGGKGTFFPLNNHWKKEILHAHPIEDLKNRRFPIRCICETKD